MSSSNLSPKCHGAVVPMGLCAAHSPFIKSPPTWFGNGASSNSFLCLEIEWLHNQQLVSDPVSTILCRVSHNTQMLSPILAKLHICSIEFRVSWVPKQQEKLLGKITFFRSLFYPMKLLHIVVCHLPRGSKLRWREDMGGGLPNTREPRVQYIES